MIGSGTRAFVLATLVVALVVACSSAPDGTLNPTTGATPTPTRDAGFTPTPGASFSAEQIEHPTGATDVVLAMGYLYGMGRWVFETPPPQFTLYGDGTVIFRPIDSDLVSANQAEQARLGARVDEDAIQALLSFALGAGRLATARGEYTEGGLSDASTTVFTLSAGGANKTVSVYGLGDASPAPGPDAADRAGFRQLAEVLTHFEQQDGLGQVSAYDPPWYRVGLIEEEADQAAVWPWSDVTLDEFIAGPTSIQAILDREHVAAILELPTGGTEGMFVAAPSGTTYQLGIRPLLPHEIAAAGLQ